MPKKIASVHPGEVLLEEFLMPLEGFPKTSFRST